MMLGSKVKDTFQEARYLSLNYPDMIVILVGKEAERLRPMFINHDLRDVEPYFLPEDGFLWKIS